MADPAPIVVTEKVWIKFATGILEGFIRRPEWNNAGSFKYYWTSRDTGNAAPDDNDLTDNGLSMRLFEKSNSDPISSGSAQDFYLYAFNSNDGDDGTSETQLRLDIS